VNSFTEARLRLVADPYPPYQYACSGELDGFDYELVTAAFAAAGLETETQLMVWEECLESLRAGESDALFQITPTPEREEWMAFSTPFREARSVIYRRRGAIPEGLEDGLETVATGRRFGALAGFSYGRSVDPIPHKIAFDSDQELLGALRRGVVDLAIVDEGVAAHLHDGDDAIEPIPGFAETRPLHVGCLREREEVVRAFDLGLDRIGVTASG
jgi:polar amino acid transport system substrate-binding protein